MIRTLLAGLLALLAGALLPLAIGAGDARTTLLDTDRWVEVTSPVVDDPGVRHELSGMLVAGVAQRLACRGGVEALLVGLAPDQLRRKLEGKVEAALASPQVGVAWKATNRTAHQRFVRAVELDRPPGEDRLLDVALLLDVVSSRVADDRASGEGRCGTSGNATQLISSTGLRRSADAARVFHEHRDLPEWLVGACVALLVLSLLLARPLVSLAAAAVGAGALALGIQASGPMLVDRATAGLADGEGAVTARALANAAIDPALAHQYTIGLGALAALLVVALAIVVRAHRA